MKLLITFKAILNFEYVLYRCYSLPNNGSLYLEKIKFTECTEQDIQEPLRILYKCWSINSSSKWSLDNPTKVPEGWHYYNKTGDNFFDFTQSQFLQ